jgi:hypothetical protein
MHAVSPLLFANVSIARVGVYRAGGTAIRCRAVIRRQHRVGEFGETPLSPGQ